jgi:S1-C subfamily serine protease
MRDAGFWTSKLVMTWAIIGPLMAGIVLVIVPSADVAIAAPRPGVLDSELRYLSSADDYVRSRPASANGYRVPLMEMEVRTGWHELKLGQRLSGVEILTVSPDGPSAAAGIRSRRAAVRTALTIALSAGALFFPPAILGAMAVQESGLGESHDLIIAVDGQRTRNLDDFMNAVGEAEPGEIVYLTVVSEGRRNQVRVELPAEQP